MLRFDTTNPPGNEAPLADMLRAHLDDAGLKTSIEIGPGGRANLIGRIEGPSDRPALVLLSHLDVVGVEADRWTRDPFGGEIDAGAVWGRGALDMKGVGAMHVHAVGELARSGKTPTREVIVCAVADEEAGGKHGAAWLLDERAGAGGWGPGRPPAEVLGEGAFGLEGVIERNVLPVVLGEKTALWVDLIARRDPGHGSVPPLDQAVPALVRALERVSGHGPPRVHPVMREQFAMLADAATGPRKQVFRGLASGAGRVVAAALARPLRSSGATGTLLSDTVTPTILEAGFKNNVVPGEARASLDCRLLPDTDVARFTAGLEAKAAKEGVGVVTRASNTGPVSAKTGLFSLLRSVSEGLASNPVVVPSLTPGFTDLRYFRARGAVAYGWVPLVVTRELLSTIHGHDERIPVEGFLRGCEAMAEAVRRAAAH